MTDKDKQIAVIDEFAPIESALIVGDLSKLTAEQRVAYYQRVCNSLGLNPLTKPFEYIVLNGKLTLYARRDAADQLRKRDNISIGQLEKELVNDLYAVTAHAETPSGRKDTATGVVNVTNLKGDALANAMMKAETKAKRRVTLSICGLGWLDETEIETIPDAKPHIVEGVVVAQSSEPAPAEGGSTVLRGVVRMMTNWAGKEVPAEAPIGPQVAGTAKFETIFVSKFKHPDHFRNHIQKHFGTERAGELTWEQAQALHDHLYDQKDDPRWYQPEPAEVKFISGWDSLPEAQKLFVAKQQEPLYNVLVKHLETRLGNINGTRLLKVMGNLCDAIGVVFPEVNDEVISEMKTVLDKEFPVG